MTRFDGVFGSIMIFWSESFYYIFTYAIYALIVCSIILFVEIKIQNNNVGLQHLVLSNFIIATLSVVLVTLSMFAVGWLPWNFGGELGKLIFTVLVMFLVICFIKLHFVNIYRVPYSLPLLSSVVTTLCLLAPYIAFNTFIFMLGSGGWQN